MQGDFYQWVVLFNRFDAFFDKVVVPRRDLQLQYDVGGEAADPPFPTRDVLAVLRVTALILENCNNKHLYQSYEVGAPLDRRASVVAVGRCPGRRNDTGRARSQAFF